jgi:hypothetical protein
MIENNIKLVRTQTTGGLRFQVHRNGLPAGYVQLVKIETRSRTRMERVDLDGHAVGFLEKFPDDRCTTNPWKAFRGIGINNRFAGAFYAEDGGIAAAISAVIA